MSNFNKNGASAGSATFALQVGLSLLVILGAVGFLFYDQLTGDGETSLVYFYNADEVLHKQDALVGQYIRMGGHVEKGSIFQKKGERDYVFSVRPHPGMVKFAEYKDRIVQVSYTGVVPDTFKEDAEVIVGGQLQGDGTFAATEVIAKCPSKYEAAEKNSGSY